MALEWFRRHQKKFLAFLTAFLMITWGFGTYLSYLVTPQRQAGTIFGRKVAEVDFREFEERWKAAFPRFGQGRETDEVRHVLWQEFALVREAERVGLEVSQAEVDAAIRQVQGGEGAFTQESYEAFLRSRRMSGPQYEEAVRENLLASKLLLFIRGQASISNTQVWERYARDNEKVKVRYIALKPECFGPQISVTEDQIAKFYDEHKNDIADPANGVYGYKLKEAVQVECLVAKYADLEKLAKIPEKDLKEYYEDHKDSYKVEPKKEEPKKPEPKKEETKKSDAKPAPEKSKPAEEAKPAAPTYRSFEEVKEEIRRKLAGSEAQRMAKSLIEKADEAVVSQLDQADRADFSKVAASLAKEGLTYVKTPFFTRDEENAGGIAGLGTAAFERTAWEPSRRLKFSEGLYIFQVIARRPAEVQPLSAVHDQVVKDLKSDLGMKKSLELAQKCQKAAGDSLDAALALAQKELPSLPTPPAAKPEEKGKGGQPKARPAEGLKIQDSDLFTRPSAYRGEEMHQFSTGLGGDRPNVAREAFELHGKAIGIAVEEKGERAVYLLQVAERKPADPAEFQKNMDMYRRQYLAETEAAILSAWMSELPKQAKLESDKKQEVPE